jgi:hypothetical protein
LLGKLPLPLAPAMPGSSPSFRRPGAARRGCPARGPGAARHTAPAGTAREAGEALEGPWPELPELGHGGHPKICLNLFGLLALDGTEGREWEGLPALKGSNFSINRGENRGELGRFCKQRAPTVSGSSLWLQGSSAMDTAATRGRTATSSRGGFSRGRVQGGGQGCWVSPRAMAKISRREGGPLVCSRGQGLISSS